MGFSIIMDEPDISLTLNNRNIDICFEGINYTTSIKKIRTLLIRHISLIEINDGNNIPSILVYLPENSKYLLVKSLKTKNLKQVPLSQIYDIIFQWIHKLEGEFGGDKSIDELEQLEKKREDRRRYLISRWGSDKSISELERLESQYQESEKIVEVFIEKKNRLERKFGAGFSLEELEELAQEDNRLKNSLNTAQLVEAERAIKKMEAEETKLRRQMFD
jgi:hypothetical protein